MSPKAVRVTHDKVAFPGTMLAERFGLGRDDTFYLAMPLFHSNAIMAGWAVAVAAGGSIALRRKFSASQFIPDVRRFDATYANYVGKPLSYVLATPPRDDDADNPLRFMYGNEGAPRDLPRFARALRRLRRRRLRVHRGRCRHRPNAGHPRRITGAADRRDRRSSTSRPASRVHRERSASW